MSTAVVTIAHGRHDHLRLQQRSLATSDAADRPDAWVLVAMADPDLVDWPACDGLRPHVLALDADPARLPLARARNAGAEAALALGADVLVFLDVDCVAAPGLSAAYARAVRDEPGTVWSGPVTYLPPPGPEGYALASLPGVDAPHPARPAPRPGERTPNPDPDLFWSLSFALSARAWSRSGGFHEGYVGYGAEDTDFARLLLGEGLASAGWALRGPFTSGTRPRARRAVISTTSCATGRCSPRGGAAGRWAAGSPRSSAKAWCGVPRTAAGRAPRGERGGTDRRVAVPGAGHRRVQDALVARSGQRRPHGDGVGAAVRSRSSGDRLVITAMAGVSAYRTTDTADVVRSALSAHFLRHDPYRSGVLLEELADERTAQDALEALVLVAAETLRVINRSPARRSLVLDRDAVVAQLVVGGFIRTGQRRLVSELLQRAAGLAAGMRSPGDPGALDGLSDHQVLVGAWAATLGLLWTAARTLRQDQATIYLRVLNAVD